MSYAHSTNVKIPSWNLATVDAGAGTFERTHVLYSLLMEILSIDITYEPLSNRIRALFKWNP